MLTARVKSYHFTGPRVGISIFCALLVSACDTGRLELNCFAFYSSLGMPAKFATFDQRFSTNMAAKHNERVDETATSNSRKFPCSTRKMILNEARDAGRCGSPEFALVDSQEAHYLNSTWPSPVRRGARSPRGCLEVETTPDKSIPGHF